MVLDINMPVMGGIEACKQIIAHCGGNKHPAIFAMSADDSAEMKQQVSKTHFLKLFSGIDIDSIAEIQKYI